MLTWITKALNVTIKTPYVIIHHPDSFIFVRLDAHPYTYLCLKLKFIYADLNHQLSILTLTWLIHTSITFLR